MNNQNESQMEDRSQSIDILSPTVNRSRPFSNIFGGVSTIDQLNCYGRQNQTSKDENQNFQNYNNLL